MRRDENHGLSNCIGSPHCRDCGGVCSTDQDRYTPPPAGAWKQVPVEVKTGEQVLASYRNWMRKTAK